MVKHKQQQALFDLLRKERGGERAAGDGKPAPVVRPLTPTAAAPAAAAPLPAAMPEKPRGDLLGPMTRVVGPRGPAEESGFRIPYGLVALAGVGIVCLCVIGYAVVQHFTQPVIPLPPTQPNPTMDTVQKGPVDPTLVPGVHPTPTSGGPVAPVKAGVVLPPVTPKGVGPVEVVTPTAKMKSLPPATKISAGVEPASTETAVTAGGAAYRIRIAQLAKTDAADELRTYLSQHGVETDLEISRGNYILYSAAHAADSHKAKDLADQINKRLEDFARETGIPTSHNAYPVQVKKE